MQFLSPTCQLLLAVFAFHEPFTRWHLASFGLIWLALAVYCVESLRVYRQAGAACAGEGEAVVCSEV
jgi:chloramphenicol-sensitive protein RarD